MEVSNTVLVETFLEMPDGRARAKGLGLEEVFDEEIEKLRKKLPHVTFRERAILGFDILAKQRPMTIEEKRAQVLWVMSRTSTGVDESQIKNHLKMYFPDWTQAQIENGVNEIKTISIKEQEGEKVKQEIARYLKNTQ